MDRKIVLDRIMLKIGLILAAVVLICSLLGIVAGNFIPAEKSREVIAANYSHKGEFTCQGYLASELFSGGTVQPNPTLFPQIIEEMEIFFSYSGAEEVKMKVTLEDKSRGWQKEILKTKGSSPVSFPLDLKNIMLLGATINAQLRGEVLEKEDETTEEREKRLLQGNQAFLLIITAEVGEGDNLFTMTLEGDLNPNTLKWKGEGFSKAERGFPGGNEWRQGAFGYRVKLKKNELFESAILERIPQLPEIATIGPDFPLSTELVESLDLNFNYRFTSDIRIDSLEEEVNVWIVVEETGRWQRTFILLPPTKKQTEFALTFPLDIGGKLREMIEDINKKIGSRGKEGKITVFVQVHTIAETNVGVINEVFEQQLSGKINEKIEWGEKGLTLIKAGTVTQKVVEPNPLPPKLMRFSSIGLGVSLLVLFALVFLYRRESKKLSFLEKELKKNRRKYRDLISEAVKYPEADEDETVIDIASLEALVKIANNLIKPVLLMADQEKQIYWISDGQIRYCYVIEDEKLKNSED